MASTYFGYALSVCGDIVYAGQPSPSYAREGHPTLETLGSWQRPSLDYEGTGGAIDCKDIDNDGALKIAVGRAGTHRGSIDTNLGGHRSGAPLSRLDQTALATGLGASSGATGISGGSASLAGSTSGTERLLFGMIRWMSASVTP